MNKHIKSCIAAVKGTCDNRAKRLKQAYAQKEGRVSATLGTVKTAVAVIGYGVYAGMPTGLREYDVYDCVQEPFDGSALPDRTDGA